MIGEDGTIEYLKNNNIKFTHTSYNAGIPEGVNKAASTAKTILLFMPMMIFIFCQVGIKLFMMKLN